MPTCPPPIHNRPIRAPVGLIASITCGGLAVLAWLGAYLDTGGAFARPLTHEGALLEIVTAGTLTGCAVIGFAHWADRRMILAAIAENRTLLKSQDYYTGFADGYRLGAGKSEPESTTSPVIPFARANGHGSD